MSRHTWDTHFMAMAALVASKSKDRSTKIGCVLVGSDNAVLSTGFNGFPRGCDDDVDARHERPEKYIWTEHAERNAIYNAARNGIKLLGCRAYVPWFPCVDCARALVQVGMSELICHRPDFEDDRWGAQFKKSGEILGSCDVGVTFFHDLNDVGQKREYRMVKPMPTEIERVKNANFMECVIVRHYRPKP